MVLMVAVVAAKFTPWPGYHIRLWLSPSVDSMPTAVTGFLQDTLHYPFAPYFAMFGNDTTHSIRMFLNESTGKSIAWRLVGGTNDTVRIDSTGIYTNNKITGTHYGDGSNLTGIVPEPSDSAIYADTAGYVAMAESAKAVRGGAIGDSTWLYASTTDSFNGGGLIRATTGEFRQVEAGAGLSLVALDLFKAGLKGESAFTVTARSDSNHVDLDICGNATMDFGYGDWQGTWKGLDTGDVGSGTPGSVCSLYTGTYVGTFGAPAWLKTGDTIKVDTTRPWPNASKLQGQDTGTLRSLYDTVDYAVNAETATYAINGGVHYAQTLVVAKSGGDFDSIQPAIDSAAVLAIGNSNRYCVKVQSGDYAEAITLANRVDILGSGRTNSRITGTTGTVLTFPDTLCTVLDMGIYVNYDSLTVASTAITSSCAAGSLIRCDIGVTKSDGDFVMHALEVTGGGFRMLECYFTYTITGATTGTALEQAAVLQSGAATIFLQHNNEYTMTCDDNNDQVDAFTTVAGSVGSYLLQDNIISVTATNTAAGFYLYGTATGATIAKNRITVDAPTSFGLYINSNAGGAIVNTLHNEFYITGAANRSAYVDAGDTWRSTFDKIDATGGYAGSTGAVKMASSTIKGAMVVTDSVQSAKFIGALTGDVTGNATTADSSTGGATRATLAANSSQLQTKDSSYFMHQSDSLTYHVRKADTATVSLDSSWIGTTLVGGNKMGGTAGNGIDMTSWGNNYDLDYIATRAKTAGDGIATIYLPQSTAGAVPYAFQFCSDSVTGKRDLVIVGQKAIAKHVIAASNDASAGTTWDLVFRAAGNNVGWSSAGDALTVKAGAQANTVFLTGSGGVGIDTGGVRSGKELFVKGDIAASGKITSDDSIRGLIDGADLPAMSVSKKGGVPATGTPSGLFLKDDGTWADAGGAAVDQQARDTATAALRFAERDSEKALKAQDTANAAYALAHDRSHSITSTSDHTSTATSGQMLKADANGLPVDATNTDAAVAAAVTASHAAAHDHATDSLNPLVVVPTRLRAGTIYGASLSGHFLGDGSDSLGNLLVVQATRLRGALTGNVTGNLTGTADSALGTGRFGSLDTTTFKAHVLEGKAATAGTADSAIAIPDSITGMVVQLPRVRSHVMPRCTTIANPASITPDADVFDQYCVTGQAQTLTINAPTGTPVGGQKLIIRVKDDGTSRTLAWNAIYKAYTGVTLSTATTLGKTMYWGFVYNVTDTKWDALASQVEP